MIYTMDDKNNLDGEKYLSKSTIASYFGVSLPTINNYMKRGIPYHKVGRRVLFRKREVDEWVDGKKA